MLDGVTVAWGLNPLDGGIRDSDNDGAWECPSTKTQGRGTYYPLCRMTASMVREWGNDAHRRNSRMCLCHVEVRRGLHESDGQSAGVQGPGVHSGIEGEEIVQKAVRLRP